MSRPISSENPSIQSLLVRLDAAGIDSKHAPDARRAITDEANTLRAALQRGDAEHTRVVAVEAERVLKMWAGY